MGKSVKKALPVGVVSVTNDTLIQLLTQVINASHFDEDLYQRVFRALGAEGKKDKVFTALSNSLEEYYNYHNRLPVWGGAREPIPPEAEDEREEIKLYTEALRQGVTDFKSLKDLESILRQSQS